MKTYSRVYAKIDLDAIAYNMEQMKQNIRPETKVMAVIKADAAVKEKLHGINNQRTAVLVNRMPQFFCYIVYTFNDYFALLF